MANYIQNDKGLWVVTVGAPGSIARAKIERPALIEALDELYAQGYGREEAEKMIKISGVTSTYESEAILHHTMYKE